MQLCWIQSSNTLAALPRAVELGMWLRMTYHQVAKALSYAIKGKDDLFKPWHLRLR